MPQRESRDIVDNDDVELGEENADEHIRIIGAIAVVLTGSVSSVTLEVLSGATVDASDLDVEELHVTLEQSQLTATKARLVSGYVSYGSEIVVGAHVDVGEIHTTNAGRIVQQEHGQ